MHRICNFPDMLTFTWTRLRYQFTTHIKPFQFLFINIYFINNYKMINILNLYLKSKFSESILIQWKKHFYFTIYNHSLLSTFRKVTYLTENCCVVVSGSLSVGWRMAAEWWDPPRRRRGRSGTTRQPCVPVGAGARLGSERWRSSTSDC